MFKQAKGLIIVIGMCVALFSNAQNTVKSPYSSFGVGDFNYAGSAWLRSMGQISQGVSSTFGINNYNPASYGKLAYTTWDFGATATKLGLTTEDKDEDFYTGSLSNLALAFPISTKHQIGFCVGINPYANVGYTVTRKVVTETFEGTETLTGLGGTTQFYMGTGFKVYKGLSAGVNFSYIFGKVQKNLLLEIPRSYNMYNLVENRTRNISDVFFDYGLQYNDTLKIKGKKYLFGAGITLTPKASMYAEDDYSVRTLGIGITDPGSIGKDSIVTAQTAAGYIVFPAQYKVGVYWANADKWSLGFDVNFTKWSDYSSFGNAENFKDQITYKLGGSFTPDATDYTSYFKRIDLRAGIRYDNGNVVVKGTRIDAMAYSFGLGLPVGKTKSKVNVGFEYITRGTTDSRLVKEDYFRFFVGILLNERWFQRYKYD